MLSVLYLAELTKHRVKYLHQIIKIYTNIITDEFEPLFEGLDYLKFHREVTVLEITLTKSELVDKNDVGYQPPIPVEEVKEIKDFEEYS